MKIGTINRLRRAMASGELEPARIYRFLKKRIEIDRSASAKRQFKSELNLPATNSVISHFTDVPQKVPTGPLSGIPFLVKDNFCLKGWSSTTCASKALHNYHSPYNASVRYLNMTIHPNRLFKPSLMSVAFV